MPVGIETTTAILDAMVEGVIVVNAAGKLVLANTAARTMLHWSSPASGQHFLEAVRQPDVVAQVEGALRGCTAHAVPVAAEQGGGAVLVLRDITDMRRIDQTRRDFVTNVSHELRTPLTAIRGYLEALRETPAPSAAMRARFLDIIDRHSGRMEPDNSALRSRPATAPRPWLAITGISETRCATSSRTRATTRPSAA